MQARHIRNVSLASAATVQAVTARNLQLLQAIDSTVDGLSSDTRLFIAIAEGFQEIFDSLQKGNHERQIDPEGIIRGSLQRAAEATSRIYSRVILHRQAACEDKELHPDDGVVEAFDEYISALTVVHDLAAEMCEWIDIHEASFEAPSGQVHTSVESLLDALSKG